MERCPFVKQRYNMDRITRTIDRTGLTESMRDPRDWRPALPMNIIKVGDSDASAIHIPAKRSEYFSRCIIACDEEIYHEILNSVLTRYLHNIDDLFRMIGKRELATFGRSFKRGTIEEEKQQFNKLMDRFDSLQEVYAEQRGKYVLFSLDDAEL